MLPPFMDMAGGYLRIIIPLVLAAFTTSEIQVQSYSGQDVTLHCSLGNAGYVEMQYWMNSKSVDALSSCKNQSFDALVTEWPADGVIEYGAHVTQQFKSKLILRADFGLILANVSQKDGGCYQCGQILKNADELIDNAIILSVTNTDVFEDEDKEDVTSEGLATGPDLTPLYICIGIAVIVASVFLVGVIIKKEGMQRMIRRRFIHRNERGEAEGERIGISQLENKGSKHRTESNTAAPSSEIVKSNEENENLLFKDTRRQSKDSENSIFAYGGDEEKGRNTKAKTRETSKAFSDAVHGIMEIPPYCLVIINTPEFQRLRYIKQLGPVSFVYPCAVHTKFDHSIGVCHLAGKLAKILQSHVNRNMTDVDRRCVEIAGLCHDLGHGPFSNTFEEYITSKKKSWRHEQQSTRIFRYLIMKNDILADLREFGIKQQQIEIICEIIYEGRESKLIPPEKFYLKQIIKNGINGVDCNTWDYVTRDAHLLGIPSAFKVERILAFVRACDIDRDDDGNRRELCFRDKVANELNHMFLTRRRLHYAAYQHRAATAVSIMFKHAFRQAGKHLAFWNENGKKYDLPNCVDDDDVFCQVTDGIVRDIMQSRSQEPGMLKAQAIIRRIHTHELYLCIKEITQDKNMLRTTNPAEIRKYLTNQDDNANRSGVWQSNRIFVEVLRFAYSKADTNPFLSIPFYAKDREETAKLLPPNKIPSDVPKQLEDVIVRVYTDVINVDLVEAEAYYDKYLQSRLFE